MLFLFHTTMKTGRGAPFQITPLRRAFSLWMKCRGAPPTLFSCPPDKGLWMSSVKQRELQENFQTHIHNFIRDIHAEKKTARYKDIRFQNLICCGINYYYNNYHDYDYDHCYYYHYNCYNYCYDY